MDRRRRWVALLALLIAVGVIVGLLVGRSDRPAPTSTGPAASAGPSAASSPAPGSSSPAATPAIPLGVSFGDELAGRSRSAVDHTLDQVVALHLTWIRIDVYWGAVQPFDGATYDWSVVDPIVASAQAHKLRVLALLSYTPPWARDAGCGDFVCPPANPNAFARFAAAVATRLTRSGVVDYQIWNEPNIGLFWHAPDASRYRTLLQATGPAIRSASPHATVLFGGLSGAAIQAGDIDPVSFLRTACRSGCPVDAVAFDPYTYPALPSSTATPLNAWQRMTSAAAGSSGLRAALSDVGLGQTAVWVTQFGAPTRYPGGTSGNLVSDQTQSLIITDGLRLARQSPGLVGAFFINTWQDSAQGGGLRDHFGLLAYDGSAKPAYTAVRAALS